MTYDKSNVSSDVIAKRLDSAEILRDSHGTLFYFCILYEFALSFSMFFTHTMLVAGYVTLISRGESNIELYINMYESKRLGLQRKKYKNPYSFGFWKNWKQFLGLSNRSSITVLFNVLLYFRSFWRNVLLPSSYPPDEDGIHWMTTYTTMSDGDVIQL
ncbi:hypothetical protein LSH36_74g06028 [Paralvinella palmiformis]|uniref:Uncharacterized protein n=1 Tax=Paralvinella palmiformis TaxID=53620 RepID=A0AAD9K2X6_9ANNE|nr:hypothetical protein LSH36_74g06028 [Paralvinella palmiformis]